MYELKLHPKVKDDLKEFDNAVKRNAKLGS
jgi:hypothetical protein